METNVVFNVDYDVKSIFVMKIYNASVSEIWDYFTKAELLDLWWGPKPWNCKTVKMNFVEGGQWLYAMVGPNGEKVYSLLNYGEITGHRNFDGMDAFCDENGKIDENFPQTKWLIGFTGVEGGVKVSFNLHFQSEEAMKKLLELGFEEGFKIGLHQLEGIINT